MTRIIEPTQEERDEAAKRKVTFRRQRTDPIDEYEASIDWMAKIEPEALEWLHAYKNIDQAVQISIAISTKRHADYVIARPDPPAEDRSGQGPEQDIRYSRGVQLEMAGISNGTAGKGPNGKGSVKDQPF